MKGKGPVLKDKDETAVEDYKMLSEEKCELINL
jgi:hypothetical protein